MSKYHVPNREAFHPGDRVKTVKVDLTQHDRLGLCLRVIKEGTVVSDANDYYVVVLLDGDTEPTRWNYSDVAGKYEKVWW